MASIDANFLISQVDLTATEIVESLTEQGLDILKENTPEDTFDLTNSYEAKVEKWLTKIKGIIIIIE